MSWPHVSFDSASPPLSDNVNATTLSVSIERAPREVSDFVPMRIVPNGAGSEVLITVFQQPEMTEAQYQQDLSLVKRDLERLKRVLEGTA